MIVAGEIILDLHKGFLENVGSQFPVFHHPEDHPVKRRGVMIV